MAPCQDVIDFISNRRSVKAQLLADPAPDDTQLADLLQASMSAPDHGAVRPWRFRSIRGDARDRLSDLFETTLRAREPDVDDESVEILRSKPLRSPLIVAVGVETMENHPKVPVQEQIVATACATQNLLLVAQAAGWGAILLTGWPAHDDVVKRGLGFADKDALVGFVYMGTPSKEPREMTRPNARQYLSDWTGAKA